MVQMIAIPSVSREPQQGEGFAPQATFTPTISEEDAVRQARLLKMLADPTRLRILSVIARHGGEVCVTEIVTCFKLEQPTISHHIRLLRDAGLINYRKRGLFTYYYVQLTAHEQVQQAIKTITNLFCLPTES
jgi:ArsR family transcriptional regulator